MEQKTSFWLRSLGLALAYGLVYAGMRWLVLMSDAGLAIIWIPGSGLRFCALLLTPVRYWPALLVGELVPLSYQNLDWLEQFGLTWVLVASVPPMLSTIPLVWLMRKRLPILGASVIEHMEGLLACAGLVSFLMGCRAAFNYVLEQPVIEQPISPFIFGIRVFMASYLGTLAIAPCLWWLIRATRKLLARRRYRWSLQQWLHYADKARAAGVMVLLGAVVGLALLGLQLQGRGQQWMVPFIFGVMLIAAWRYGCRGMAIVGAAANTAMVCLMPQANDFAALCAQAVMCVAMTGLMLFSAKSSRNLQLAQQEQKDLALARQELIHTEKRRTRSAMLLEEAVRGTQQEVGQLLQMARQNLPSQAFRAHAQRLEGFYQSQRRLAASMAPRAWLHFGGLRGPLAEALQLLSIRCVTQEPAAGDQLGQVPSELGLAMYRLACEAVVYLVEHEPRQELRLHMAAQLVQGQGLVLKGEVESCGPPLRLPGTDAAAWLKTELDTTGLNAEGMAYRAKLFGGGLAIYKAKATQGMRVTMQLMEHGQHHAPRRAVSM